VLNFNWGFREKDAPAINNKIKIKYIGVLELFIAIASLEARLVM